MLFQSAIPDELLIIEMVYCIVIYTGIKVLDLIKQMLPYLREIGVFPSSKYFGTSAK